MLRRLGAWLVSPSPAELRRRPCSRCWPNHGGGVGCPTEKADKAGTLSGALLGAYDPEDKSAPLIRPDYGKLDSPLESAAATKLPAPGADCVGTIQLA